MNHSCLQKLKLYTCLFKRSSDMMYIWSVCVFHFYLLEYEWKINLNVFASLIAIWLSDYCVRLLRGIQLLLNREKWRILICSYKKKKKSNISIYAGFKYSKCVVSLKRYGKKCSKSQNPVHSNIGKDTNKLYIYLHE